MDENWVVSKVAATVRENRKTILIFPTLSIIYVFKMVSNGVKFQNIAIQIRKLISLANNKTFISEWLPF